MSENVFRAALTVAFAFATAIWVATAAAITPIASCPQTLDKPGETYTVANDLTVSGTCFTVAADRITIDFKDHALSGDLTPGAGVTDGGVARLGTTVKNGSIDSFQTGIDLAASTRSQVLNMSVEANNGPGIAAGSHTLVKGRPLQGRITTCVVVTNGSDGIQVGDFSQVQTCFLTANDGDGIRAGSHALVTRNVSFLNAGAGIATEAFGTITWNVTDENGGDGISAGARSLVTNNVADDNSDHGIAVTCPGTVTNNEAMGNIGGDYLIPAGCMSHNNQ